VRIALISRDGSLLPLLSGWLPQSCRLQQCEVVQADGEHPVEADIYRWGPGLVIPGPHFLGQGQRRVTFFLVRRPALKAFLERFPQAGPSTLLKPGEPGGCSRFLLGHLAERHKSCIGKESGGFRPSLKATVKGLLERPSPRLAAAPGV